MVSLISLPTQTFANSNRSRLVFNVAGHSKGHNVCGLVSFDL